jgi:hypothetical protein
VRAAGGSAEWIPRLDSRKFERKLKASRARRSMTTDQTKPVIFISYAHADEPENPREGEEKWLSFVKGHLLPAVKHGAVDIWVDTLMQGGDDWDPEIERRLRGCDVFVLLVSRYSTSSDYVVDKEIAIIRDRQKNGEDVRFYPLLLTPTADAGLDVVRDKNMRPRFGRPFSTYSQSDRDQHMAAAANEIADIAAEIAARKSAPPQSPATPSPPEPAVSSPQTASTLGPPPAPSLLPPDPKMIGRKDRLKGAGQGVIERWRRHYNTERPRGPVGMRAASARRFIPALAARPASQSRPAAPPAQTVRPTMN